ncbi:MAG TPA: protoporphyrinogen oxidase [Polyangiaceae bacterium]|nr:protoporphyrinogen oxidase [Polyangiaceae bacterium]
MFGGTNRVVVIGGGLSGLAVSHALIREANREGRALRLTMLERGKRLGGNIHTEQKDGFVIEAGPDSFVVTRPHALHLCEELGLSPRLIETNPAHRRVYIARRGRLLPMPQGLVLGIPSRVRPFLRSPLLSVRGKLRALREVVKANPDAGGGDISLGDFLERRFGREMVDVILEPLLGGIYAGDASRLSLRSTFPDWFSQSGSGSSLVRSVRAEQRAKRKAGPSPSPFRSLVSGMGELIDTLAGRVGAGAVRFGAEVLRVEREQRAFRVVMSDGELEADHVVVALPACAAARLLSTFDEQLGRELESIEYVSTATVTLAYQRSQIRHPLDAAGFLVPRSEGLKVTAGTFISSKWEGRAPEGHALVRGFVGGAHDETTASLPEDELVRIVRGELGRMLGVSGEPAFARVYRYIKASPQPLVGHFERVARIRERVAKTPGLYVIGNAYDGVGIPDCVRLAEQAASQMRAGH